MNITLQDCQDLDAHDPLRGLRKHFTLAESTIYLDGNSLGAMPAAAPARVAEVVSQEWGADLIQSWNKAGWFDLPRRVGDKIARLIGVGAGEVVATDTTSVNLFKVLSAARNIAQADAPQRRRIVSERSNFPTDLYIAEGLCRQHGWELALVEPDEVAAALTDDVAILMLTHVNYRTGAMHDMPAVTAAAHARGILVVWDLCHSAGAVPVDLAGAQADFAVGCGYKYLNGGPGAPGFIYVAERLHEAFEPAVRGWHGHAAPFAMSPEHAFARGIDRARISTPPILSLLALEAALGVFEDLEIEAVRERSLSLTDFLVDCLDALVPELELVTPREAERRGSQVSVRFAEGFGLVRALAARGVVGDYRDPGIVRLGVAAPYVTHSDLLATATSIRQVIDAGEHLAVGEAEGVVT